MALLGHSMGAAGSLVAAAGNPDVAGGRRGRDAGRSGPSHPPDVPPRQPADPRPRRVAPRLAHDARLPAPARTHDRIRECNPGGPDIAVPVLLAHGTDDGVVPVSDLDRLAAARRAAQPRAVTETFVVAGGRHSWLYEFPAYRAAIGRFLATSLGGPLPPDEAAAIAEAVDARRLPEPERLTTLDEEPGGIRSLTRLVRRHRTPTPGPIAPTRGFLSPPPGPPAARSHR